MAEISSSGGSRQHHGKIRRKRSTTRIDMTPMVDLAFLLLTFFMLSMQLQELPTLEMYMEKMESTSQSKPISADRVVTLLLDEKDKIYWYRGADPTKVAVTNYSSAGIRKLILEKNAEIGNMHIFVKASKKSKYKNLIDIFDEFLITDFKNFSLVKITDDEVRAIATANH